MTAEKSAGQLLNQLKDPKLLTAILATAGASGVAGGFLSSQGPERRNETRSQRRMRILRNALLSAGAGAGAVGLGAVGYKSLSEALPKDDVDPVTGAATSVFGRTLAGATAYGGTGMALDATWRKRKANEYLNMLKTEPQRDPISQLRGILQDPEKRRGFRNIPGVNTDRVFNDMGMSAPKGNFRGGATAKAMRSVSNFARPRAGRLAAGAAGFFWPEALKALSATGDAVAPSPFTRGE